MAENGALSTRQGLAIVCSVIAVVCSIAAAVVGSDGQTEDSPQDQYQECLTEERARIAEEGGLLEAEDWCESLKP